MSRQIPPDRHAPAAPSLAIPLDLNAVGPATPRQPGSGRTIVLVGLMGAGKTTIGRILAAQLGVPFVDSDEEIERAAGYTIADLFQKYGEPEFRRGERLVIRRLLSGPPVVLATGGGAFMDSRTRASVREHAISIWLRCPLPVLVQRVADRTHRPLLNAASPHAVLANLMELRHPVYAEADIIVDCGDDNVEHSADHVMQALKHNRQPLRVPVRLDRASYDLSLIHI